MVARGEIGFLIAAIAQSEGVFPAAAASSDLYMTVIWAVVLCTLLGPVAVGLLVMRVKRLEAGKEGEGEEARHGVLGSWGVDGTRGRV